MKITIKRNEAFTGSTCVICGTTFPPDIIIATASSDDGQKTYGAVCPTCIQGGLEAMRASLRQRVQHLRDQAEELLAIADDLEQEVERRIVSPSWGEWQEAHLLAFLQRVGMTEDQRIKHFRQRVREWSLDELNGYLNREIDVATKDDPYQQALHAVAWHERERRRGLAEDW